MLELPLGEDVAGDLTVHTEAYKISISLYK